MNKFTRATGTAILTLGLLACGESTTPEEHVARAKEYLALADYQAAIIEFKNALQQDGRSGEARLLLGQAYLNTGDAVSAEKELRRAQQLGRGAAEIAPSLAQALLLQEKFDALSEIDTTTLAPADQALVMALQARASMARGELTEAKALIDQALALQPSEVEALLARAELMFSQGELAEADAALKLVLVEDPDNAEVWALRGDIAIAEQDPQSALSHLKTALDKNPGLHTERMKLALLALQGGDLELAEEQTRKLEARSPKHPAVHYINGLLAYQAGDYAKTINRLSLVEPQYEQFPLSLFFLGSAHLQQGNTDQAAVLAARFHSLSPDSVAGRKLLATCHLQQRDFDSIPPLLLPVKEALPEDVDTLNLLASAYMAQGKVSEGIELLEAVAKLQPDSATAQVKLGAGLLMDGKDDEAARHMQSALDIDPELQQADILLVLNLVQKGDFKGAVSAAESYRERHPDSTTPLNLLGRVHLAARQPDKARSAFEQALAIEPGDITANQGLANMALAKGDTEQARTFYNNILAQDKNNLQGMMLMALLEARDGNNEAFVAGMEAAGAAHPQAVEPRLALGQYYLQQNRPDKVAPLFSSLPQVERDSAPVLKQVALAQLAQSQFDGAVHSFEKLLAIAPETAATHYFLAMSRSGSGDPTGAEQSLKDALQLDSEHVAAQLALTRMALARGQDELFNDRLERLTVIAPQHPQLPSLQAARAARQGDLEAARNLAEQAFKANPSSDTVGILGTYTNALGDSEAAIALYTTWLQERPADIQTRMLLANLLLVEEREDDALAEFEQVVARDENNLIALNNAAWYLREQEPARALDYALRARELAPNSPDVLDTLAVVQFANRDYERAAANVKEALLRKPDDPSIRYHSAMIKAAGEDKAQAREELQALLASGVEFPQKSEAQALLAELQ